MKRALILVDIQNDFLPGGALAVPNGDEVVGVANRLMPHFDLVVATQDWHPAHHGSFADSHRGKRIGEMVDLRGVSQVLWPRHCVQETEGAEFAPGLDAAGIHKVVRKGADPGVDSYSGFFDNDRHRDTGLADYLRSQGVTDLYIMGLATDYCVKFTALDARRLGFNTHLIEDGCRGVELQAGDVQKALDEKRAAGIAILRSTDLG